MFKWKKAGPTQGGQPAQAGPQGGAQPAAQQGQKPAEDPNRKFSRGVDCNMKIIIRGDRGTGKTALFNRLQNKPLPTEYVATPEIEVANISWRYKATSGVIKCEIWDIVDKGISQQKKQQQQGLKFATPDTNSLLLDATFVNVYNGTSGVIFIMDITKQWSWEYIQRELPKVPAGIPVLVLGNFRDMEASRCVTAEDVSYFFSGLDRPEGSGVLLYAESSIINDFGLLYVHSFFNLPFLYVQRRWHEDQLKANMREAESAQADLDNMLQSKDHDFDAFMAARLKKLLPPEASGPAAVPGAEEPESTSFSRQSSAMAINIGSLPKSPLQSPPESPPGSLGTTPITSTGVLGRLRASLSKKKSDPTISTSVSTSLATTPRASVAVVNVDDFRPDDTLDANFFGDDGPSSVPSSAPIATSTPSTSKSKSKEKEKEREKRASREAIKPPPIAEESDDEGGNNNPLVVGDASDIELEDDFGAPSSASEDEAPAKPKASASSSAAAPKAAASKAAAVVPKADAKNSLVAADASDVSEDEPVSNSSKARNPYVAADMSDLEDEDFNANSSDEDLKKEQEEEEKKAAALAAAQPKKEKKKKEEAKKEEVKAPISIAPPKLPESIEFPADPKPAKSSPKPSITATKLEDFTFNSDGESEDEGPNPLVGGIKMADSDSDGDSPAKQKKERKPSSKDKDEKKSKKEDKAKKDKKSKKEETDVFDIDLGLSNDIDWNFGGETSSTPAAPKSRAEDDGEKKKKKKKSKDEDADSTHSGEKKKKKKEKKEKGNDSEDEGEKKKKKKEKKEKAKDSDSEDDKKKKKKSTKASRSESPTGDFYDSI